MLVKEKRVGLFRNNLSLHNFDVSLLVHCKLKKKKKFTLLSLKELQSPGLHFVFTFSVGLISKVLN